MRLHARLYLAVLAVALTGCPEYDKYELELKPDGKTIARKLTCWREGSRNGKVSVIPFSASALAEMEKVYGKKPVEQGPRRYQFQGRFTGRMPHDIGGSGRHLLVESPLGSVSAYMERFRGDDDLVGKFERLANATNRLTDLLLGWFETQMGQEANWPKVRGFLDMEFRRDLHNLALYIRLAGVAASPDEPCGETKNDDELPDAITSTTARLGQYLIDHGYLDPDEFLEWGRRLRSEFKEPSAERVKVLRRVQGLVVAKAKLDSLAGAGSLGFLLDEKKMAESISQFLRQTPEYGKLQRDRAAQRRPAPDPEEILGELILNDILDFHLFESADKLELSLATTEKPLATNGCWNEADRVVRWRQPIDRGGGLPTLCFAVWSQPDVAFQERRFGRVVLRGGELAKYAGGYSMLGDEERTMIDQFVGTLRPDADPKASVRKFIVDHRKANPDLAELGELLSQNLGK